MHACIHSSIIHTYTHTVTVNDGNASLGEINTLQTYANMHVFYAIEVILSVN